MHGSELYLISKSVAFVKNTQNQAQEIGLIYFSVSIDIWGYI